MKEPEKQEESKPDFEKLSNDYTNKDNLIVNHLYPLLEKSSLDYLSLKYAVEYGSISGALRLALHKMLTSYSDDLQSQLSSLKKENEELKRLLLKCKANFWGNDAEWGEIESFLKDK